MLSDFELSEIFQNNMRDPLTLADDKGIYVMVNEPAARNLGMTQTELMGLNAKVLIERGLVDKCPTIAALEQKKAITQVFYASENKLNPSRKPYFATAVPIFHVDGTLAGVLTSTCSCDTLEEFLRLLKVEKQKRSLREETISYMLSINQHTLVYTSDKMKTLIRNCTAIAKTSSTILLTGESGSGKEVLARYIHSVSDRSERAFIPVNCAAIPQELFESEFFGYAAGAFTGANKAGKPGFLKMANEGTLFLDEVGELPLLIQSKLLRFIESGEYFPVGSTDLQTSNIRIIAATNRSLRDMVSAGTFREDLFYRLNVLPLVIPPLRERPNDIPVLADHFVKEFNRKHGKNYIMSNQTLDELKKYPYPGNVRELRNIIERMVLLDASSWSDNSIPAIALPVSASVTNPIQRCPTLSLDLTLKEALEEFEAQYIQAVLNKYEGHVADAAKSLNIHRSTLYRKKQR